MPRICTVCAHPQREEIDTCLVSDQSMRGIARRFRLDDAAVLRHRNAHLPAQMARAHEAQETVRADGLLAQVQSLQRRALGILERAEADGDARTALQGVREVARTLELQGKLLGRLSDRPQVAVGVTVNQRGNPVQEDPPGLAKMILEDPDLCYAAQEFLTHLERAEMELRRRARGAASAAEPDMSDEPERP